MQYRAEFLLIFSLVHLETGHWKNNVLFYCIVSRYFQGIIILTSPCIFYNWSCYYYYFIKEFYVHYLLYDEFSQWELLFMLCFCVLKSMRGFFRRVGHEFIFKFFYSIIVSSVSIVEEKKNSALISFVGLYNVSFFDI